MTHQIRIQGNEVFIEDVFFAGNMFVYSEVKKIKWYHKMGLTKPYTVLKKWRDWEPSTKTYSMNDDVKILHPNKKHHYKIGYYEVERYTP